MKGLYCQLSEHGEDASFVFQEVVPPSVLLDHFVKVQVKACALSAVKTKLITELKLGPGLIPSGREIAGIVLEVGQKVSFFHPDEAVVGILPLDSEDSGLCDIVFVHEHFLVHKPEKVTWIEAAGTIRDGLCAYTALHYLCHITAGNTILVMDGASPFGTIVIQLANHRGAKVISTVHSSDDEQYLEGLHPTVARVVNLSSGKANLVENCMEETGGLGVDIIIDSGVRLYNGEDESPLKQHLPHKHEILCVLAVGGHWITTMANLQLDPPDSHLLYLKGGTVSFLNDEVWSLSNVQQGKYLHILKDVMEKLSNRIFRPLLDEPIPLYEAVVSMEMVQKNHVRKKQVIQL